MPKFCCFEWDLGNPGQ